MFVKKYFMLTEQRSDCGRNFTHNGSTAQNINRRRFLDVGRLLSTLCFFTK